MEFRGPAKCNSNQGYLLQRRLPWQEYFDLPLRLISFCLHYNLLLIYFVVFYELSWMTSFLLTNYFLLWNFNFMSCIHIFFVTVRNLLIAGVKIRFRISCVCYACTWFSMITWFGEHKIWWSEILLDRWSTLYSFWHAYMAHITLSLFKVHCAVNSKFVI